MKEAGCRFICYGVESGNQRILDLAKKRITLKKIRDSIALTNEVGIHSLSSFILGLPGETIETVKESLEFGESLGNQYAFHILAPYPGTEVRDRAEELGLRILHSKWLRYDANQAVSETRHVSAEYINRVVKDFNDSIEAASERKEELKKQGKISRRDEEEIELRRRRRFVWQILKNDYIEKHGRFKSTGDSVELLAEKLYSLKAVSSILKKDQISEEIGKMLKEGILGNTLEDNSITWFWTKISRREK